jgi:hypothetical protein
LITPIGFEDKAFESKRYAVFDQTQPLHRLTTPSPGVFDQTFFEKVCGQAFFEKVCDHACFMTQNEIRINQLSSTS